MVTRGWSAHGWAAACAALLFVVPSSELQPRDPGRQPRASEDGPVVHLNAGRMHGERLMVGGVAINAFRGIPFAAPPVGPLRWRPPQPVTPWEDVREARQFRPACPQAPGIRYGTAFTEQSEDCLYLNVWTPATDGAGKRPVMVWIHGGGNVIGGAGSRLYDGSWFAAAGLVLVSIQYRLGPLGYLAHPSLTREARERDGRAASGNYGLLDQVAALTWIRDNIEPFGGDRGRVTVFGESAGAADITHLMASPLSRGLFHRAIAESGYFGENVPRLDEALGVTRSGHQIGLDVAARLGVKGEGSDALQLLRALPVDRLLSVPMTVGGGGLGSSAAFRFGPIVDGYVLPRDPGDAWAGGAMHQVPFIAGSNLDDGSVFTRGQPVKGLPGYCLTLGIVFGADSDRAAKLFPAEHAEEVPAAIQRVATMLAFRAPARRLVREVEGAGGRAWLYLFSRNPLEGTPRDVGVVHGLEIPYVFGTLADTLAAGALIDRTDRALSAEMMRRWVAFARDGDPNGQEGSGAGRPNPAWPRYARTEDEHLEFGDHVVVGRHLDHDACDLIDQAAARRRRGSR